MVKQVSAWGEGGVVKQVSACTGERGRGQAGECMYLFGFLLCVATSVAFFLACLFVCLSYMHSFS